MSRAFAAPVDQVFDAWTNAEILRQWWGPHVVEVVECEMDARDGGAYRITMQMPDFQRYPMFGTLQDVDRPRHFALRVELSEHPDEWLALFRPKGSHLERVVMEWFYEISFLEADGATVVEVLATYPVLEDRDAMISMGGEIGWGESFEKLDALLGSN